jgi:hypothetical protein
LRLLQDSLTQTLQHAPADALAQFSQLIDKDWIEQALLASGKASIRRRKLPAEHAIWLVIGLSLYRQLPMWQVVHQLSLSLDGQTLPAPSASVQARQRLGSQPLQELFQLLTRAWSRPSTDTGTALRVLAVDGVVWSAPDTPENRASLGSCATQHGPLPWPQVRAVCLLDTDTHELLDAQLGGIDQGELLLADNIQGIDDSLTVFDRAYFSAAFLLKWQRGQQRHWLMRAKDNLRHEVVQQLSPGEQIIHMPISQRARQLDPTLPLHWQARLITVTVKGQTRRFITSLLDPHAHPAHCLLGWLTCLSGRTTSSCRQDDPIVHILARSKTERINSQQKNASQGLTDWHCPCGPFFFVSASLRTDHRVSKLNSRVLT